MKYVKSFRKEYSVSNSAIVVKLGEKGVTDIKYHEPIFSGDSHYCEVTYKGGYSQRLFKPDEVTFFEEEPKSEIETNPEKYKF
jgi:hypothetical protein